MFKRVLIYSALLMLAASIAACAPTTAPATTPTAAPAAAPTKAAEPTRPPATTAPTAAPKAASLKFGGIPSAAFAALYLAMDKGYFKEQGIDLEATDFRTIQDLIAPLGTGQLDVAATPLSTPLLAAFDRGVDIRMVAIGSMLSSKVKLPQATFENNWVMLRKDLKDSGQVKQVKDLKGMKVAIPSQGGIGDQTVQMMLEQAGMKAEDVEIIVLPTAEQSAAFANKAIAAGYIMEPQVAASSQQGLAEKWIPVSSFFEGQVQNSAIVFGPTLLKDKELGRRWMLAYLKGLREYLKALTTKEGRDEVLKAVAAHTPVKDKNLLDAIELPYVDPNGLPDAKSVQAQYKWWVEKGFYKGQKTFSDMTDLSYLEYATQTLGKQ